MFRLSLPLLAAAALTAGEPTAGLTLYASFDQGLTPDYAAGARSAEGTWRATAGVLGGAYHGTGGDVVFPSACNFNLPRGTAAWWVKIAEDPHAVAAAGQPKPALIAAMNLQLMAEPRTSQWLFMTGTSLPGENFAWSYAPSCPFGSIPVGRWTHMALTWDQATGIKTIVINGKEVARAATRQMRSCQSGTPLRLGSSMPGDYDELLIWDRVITLEEITRVHTDPTAIAVAARALPAPQDKPWEIAPMLVTRPALEGLVDPGGTFTARIPVENRTSQTCTATITLTLLDLWERPSGEPQIHSVTLPAQGKTVITASFTAPRLGIFKVQAAIDGRSRDVASFGCVPPGNPPDHPFFGAHVQGSPGTAEFGRRIGFSRSRVHDMQQFTWWQRMEPERGEWTEKCKEPYQSLSRLGYAHWGEWMATPHWAVTLPDGSHPQRHDGYPRPWVPTDLDAVRTYVRKTLEWYPDIREWEVWNEPNVSSFWAGSPKDYADLAAVMYAEAKRVRPDIEVFVQFGAGGPWYRDAVQAGLLDHADGVSFHAYASTQDHPQTWTRMVNDIKKAIAAAGHPGLPIVDSEGGLVSRSFIRGTEGPKLPPESRRTYDFATAAALIVQWRVTMMAAGVRSHYYYFLCAENSGRDGGHCLSLADATGGPTPAAIAQNALVWQLDRCSFASETPMPQGLRCYLFERADGTSLAVLWGEDDASGKMLGHGATAIDLMGNPIRDPDLAIGPMPAYLRFAVPAAEAAKRIAGLNFAELIAGKASASSLKGVKAPKPMDRFSLANEAGPQRLIPISMAAAANMGLADPKAGDGIGGWLDEGPYNDLSMLATGRHEWLGVPFQIGSATQPEPCIVTLRGRTFSAGPMASEPVPIGRKVRALFFCHGANWAAKPGTAVAAYDLLYADGTTASIPVVYGQAVSNWWNDHQEGEDSRTLALLAKDPQEPTHPWRFLRIWQWENPRSDVLVQSVRVRSVSQEVTFSVVGITAATW